MSRGHSPFRQHDVTRALRAARAAGLEVTGYEIEPETGKIIVRIATGKGEQPADTELDRWLKEHAG